MRLIYLYVKKFPPYSGAEFSLDSNVRCTYHDGLLDVESFKVLPDDFFSLRKREGVFGRMSCSALIGANGCGKTSFARFLQAIFFQDAKLEYVLVFEKGPHDLWVWYNLKKVKLRFGKCCYDGKAHEPISRLPEEYRIISQGVQDCFDVLYYSPHFTVGAPQFSNSDTFHDMSTAGLMRSDVNDLVTQVDDEPRMIGNNDAFDIRETNRILKFVVKLNQVNADLPARFRVSGLPRVKSVEVRWNDWARKELAAYFRNRARPMYENGVYAETPLHVQDERMAELLSFGYQGDFLTNVFVTFCGNCWRNFKTDKDVSSTDNRLGQAGYELVQCLRNDMEHDTIEHVHDSILNFVERFDKDFAMPLDMMLRKDQGGEYPLGKMFRLIVRLMNEFPRAFKKNGFTVDLGDSRMLKAFSELIDLHARSRWHADYLIYEFKPHLSAGTSSFLSLFARINDFYERYYARSGGDDPFVNPDSYSYAGPVHCGQVLILDEAETSLHPEWQQNLVKYVIWFFENFFPREKVHVIFASHSPILLSDIPSGNVHLFGPVRMAAGGADDLNNTFGANIHDLYRNKFFLPLGPMGNFAQEKINGALKSVASVLEKKHARLDDDSRCVLDVMGDRTLREYVDALKEGLSL